MESIGKDCTELKHTYDSCFNKWYSEKFLKGETEPDSKCEEIFTEYKACVMKVIKEKGIDQMLTDARRDSSSK
ncbi:Mitochondrial distribution and morphology protein 35 [Basidiobolus ranarum]|uniref:Mitochondrial distribution and morphology protein 35 n=1 Tax=Basidiobolus ranarum TaxID=34480 RepID=A0ABR2W3R1_9FUNG